jgi:hypothetical protein
VIQTITDAFPCELLRSERHRDGRWHAVYPTATLTLCGREKESQGKGRPGQPTCLRCLGTALAFRRIDGSAPVAWTYAA